MQKSSALSILNLCGELPKQLEDYFQKRGIKVIDSSLSDEQLEWTHILIKDIQEFDFLSATYQTLEKDIKLITLSNVLNPKSFIWANGRLIFNELWMNGPIGTFILDKFFQEYATINIDENYPSFEEKGSFNVSNPFNTGEYLDRMVHEGHKAGIEALAVKTFFDHILMYLTGLKNLGKVGFPIEVSFGVQEGLYGVQLHFFGQDLCIEDVTGSLSNCISKKAEEHLLTVAVQSSDFFDLTFVSQVNKVVMTALWTQDKRIKYENRGLMFASVTPSASMASYPTTGATSSLVQYEEIPDLSSMVDLSRSKPGPDQVLIVANEEAVEEEVIRVIGCGDVEAEEQIIIKATPIENEKDSVQVLKAGTEEKEDALRVSGGSVEAEEQITIEVTPKENEKASVQLVKEGTEVDRPVLKFSGRGLKKEEGTLVFSKMTEDTSKGKFKLMNLGSIPQPNKKDAFFIRSTDPNKAQNDSAGQVVKGGASSEDNSVQVVKATEQIANPLFKAPPSNMEKELLKKLGDMTQANSALTANIKTLMTELNVLKDSRKRVADIQAKVEEESANANANANADEDKAIRLKFQELAAQGLLGEEDQIKLSTLLEKEAKLLEVMKQEEIKARKLQIEMRQKETIFTLELEKFQRLNKAKDLFVEKSKETFQRIVDNKDFEIDDLRNKLDQMNNTLASANTSSQTTGIEDLERQNQNSKKMLEAYKLKINSLSNSLQASKQDDGSIKGEIKRLEMQTNHFKNQVDVTKRELVKLQEKIGQDTILLGSLRQDKLRLEQQLKKVTYMSRKEQVNPSANLVSNMELKKAHVQNQMLEAQTKEANLRVKDLESKLAEAIRAAQNKMVPEDGPSKVKISHLEASMKKLTVDLVESRNQVNELKKETNRLRQEKTAIKNQLDSGRRELDKIKAAMPKKPSGGKAAA